MKLGVRLESFGQPIRGALAAAAKLEVVTVQFDAVGDLAPQRLGETGRKELRHLLRSHGLELGALHAPLRHGLGEPLNLQPRVERLMQALSLSRDLGAGVVVVQAGEIPEKEDDPRRATLREAAMALSAHGDRVGAVLALETGLEPTTRLADFLTGFDSGGLGVCYDPANLLLHGHDPVASLAPLKERLTLCHARDVRRASASRSANEVPIGHGDLEWMGIVGTLAALEFRGAVIVETEDADPRAVEQGMSFLRRLI
jgi:sugar phosphate isomerase/epimerase